jgi:hypothetical protein
MTPQPAGEPIEVLLVEDDPGDVLLIREAFDDMAIVRQIDEFFVSVVRLPS